MSHYLKLALTGVVLAAPLGFSALAQEPERVVLWAPGDNGTVQDWNTDPILQVVEEATNTDIEIVKIGFDVYAQRVNAAFASREVPDIIAQLSNYAMIFELADQGALAPFEGEVGEAAPNVLAMYEEGSLDDMKVDGKVYGQPVYWNSTESPVGAQIHIRKDLLDALGLAVPETFDEYFGFLEACSEANGIPGVTFNGVEFSTGALSAFTGAFGLPTGGWTETAEGYASVLIQPEMKEALLLFREMVAQGLSDPAAWENDQDATRTQYVSGGACSVIFNGGGHIGRIQNDFDLADKGYQNFLLPAPSAGGEARGYTLGPSFFGLTVVPNLRGNNPVAAARVLNYLNSEEGLKLTALGVEGTDYTETNGEIELLPARAERGFPAEAGDTGAHPLATPIVSWVPQEWQDFQLLYGKPEAFKTWYDAMQANMYEYTLPSTGSLIQTDAGTQYAGALGDLTERYLIEIIRAGSEEEAAASFDAFVAAWRAAGGDQVTAEVNEVLSASN